MMTTAEFLTELMLILAIFGLVLGGVTAVLHSITKGKSPAMGIALIWLAAVVVYIGVAMKFKAFS